MTEKVDNWNVGGEPIILPSLLTGTTAGYCHQARKATLRPSKAMLSDRQDWVLHSPQLHLENLFKGYSVWATLDRWSLSLESIVLRGRKTRRLGEEEQAHLASQLSQLNSGNQWSDRHHSQIPQPYLVTVLNSTDFPYWWNSIQLLSQHQLKL